jgi:hypothetical protein
MMSGLNVSIGPDAEIPDGCPTAVKVFLGITGRTHAWFLKYVNRQRSSILVAQISGLPQNNPGTARSSFL